MYASITNFIAQNEMQMDMWIEFFKSQSAKLMTNAGLQKVMYGVCCFFISLRII